jgi:hypothetical protein
MDQQELCDASELKGTGHLPTDAKRKRQNTRFNVPGERPMVSHLGVEIRARLSEAERKSSADVKPASR